MTIEKVKSIAKEKYGKDLTDEQAAMFTAKFGKLSDDELDSVTGGCDSYAAFEVYNVQDTPCPGCGSRLLYYKSEQFSFFRCDSCGYMMDKLS